MKLLCVFMLGFFSYACVCVAGGNSEYVCEDRVLSVLLFLSLSLLR